MTFAHDFLSLFFPRCCYGCGEPLVGGEDLICTRCIHDLPRTHAHVEPNTALWERLHGRMHLDFALAFLQFQKRSIVQRLIHALKYRSRPEIGRALGSVYGRELSDRGFHFDLIIPVPLHPSKLKRRGYNQSAEFARGLAAGMHTTLDETNLQRIVRTSTQTRKNRLQRWENVKDAFRVRDEAALQGRRLLLVDDVITTGATMEACGLALARAGCRSLSIACIAFA